MAKRIAHLLEEQENQSKLLRTINLAVEVERTQADLKHLYVQESRAPTLDREEVLALNPTKDHQQSEVTMPIGDKNQNGKRNLVTQITGKKARKLSKKKAKLEKLREVPEKTSQKGGLQNSNFIGISKQLRLALRHGKAM
jgi:ribosomal protein RSM22 (predicted rRNA methylase)